MEFDKDWCKRERGMEYFQPSHQHKVGRQMTKLINPDIWFGNIAITYANKLVGERWKKQNMPNGNEQHYLMDDLSALWREQA